MSKQYTIGFDLGGTKMAAALVNQDFTIEERIKTATDAQHGTESVIKRIADTVTALIKQKNLDQKQVLCIGIAIPGPVDHETGEVLETPNLPFGRLELRRLLQEKIDIPVFLENDVNAGTFGEFKAGAAKGYTHVIGVFPGTGLGGGLILNGKLFRGANGNAGELGHMIIQRDGAICGCGKRGCLETLTSRTAMAKDAVAAAASGKAPATLELAGTDIKKYKSKVFLKAIEAGDQRIIEIIDKAAENLGLGIANVVNVLNPELVVIGGGLVEKLGDYYVKRIDESMRKFAMPGIVDAVKTVQASLDDDAVIIGAAALAEESYIHLKE